MYSFVCGKLPMALLDQYRHSACPLPGYPGARMKAIGSDQCNIVGKSQAQKFTARLGADIPLKIEVKLAGPASEEPAQRLWQRRETVHWWQTRGNHQLCAKFFPQGSPQPCLRLTPSAPTDARSNVVTPRDNTTMSKCRPPNYRSDCEVDRVVAPVCACKTQSTPKDSLNSRTRFPTSAAS